MVHPVLTIMFDLMLIGTAFGVIVTMVAEHLASRRPAVGAPCVRAAVINGPASVASTPGLSVEGQDGAPAAIAPRGVAGAVRLP